MDRLQWFTDPVLGQPGWELTQMVVMSSEQVAMSHRQWEELQDQIECHTQTIDWLAAFDRVLANTTATPTGVPRLCGSG